MKTNTPKPVTRAHALVLLCNWKDVIESVSKVRDLLTNEVARDGITFALAEYTEAVAEVVGDTTGALGWFWQLNDMGANALNTSKNAWGGEYRRIETLTDLLWVIGYEEPTE